MNEFIYASEIYERRSALLPRIAIKTSLSVFAFTYCSQNCYIYLKEAGSVTSYTMSTACESVWIKAITSIIGTRYGPEPLLTCSIPDLKFADFIINIEHFESEIHAYCRQIILNKVIITEPQKQGRLPNTLIPYQYYFKDVVLLFYHFSL